MTAKEEGAKVAQERLPMPHAGVTLLKEREKESDG